MNQGAIEIIPAGVEQAFGDLQSRIMEDVVRRIKINGFVTRSADWQITRLKQLGESEAYIRQQIQTALQLSDEAIESIYTDAIGREYIRNAELYKLTGASITSFADNKELQDLISAVKTQTKDTLNNITGSLGFVTQDGTGIKALDLTTFYQKTLDAALGDIATAGFDYNKAIRRSISEMTNSGLRWIDYESGWHNRVTVAARRAVMTGFNQTMSHINEQTAKDLETDYFEVTWHMGARPEHMTWQGKVYSKQQLIEVCGLGSGGGLKGWNCYHDYLAFVPGASVRSYTDEQLERMNAAEMKPQEYKGKEYTTYEGLQRQRQLETNMRAQRQEIALLKQGSAAETDILNAQVKYRVTSAEYTGLSSALKLPQQRERILMDGLGSVKNTKVKEIAESPDLASLRKAVVKPGKTAVKMDVSTFPDSFQEKSGKKKTQKFVDYLNGVKDADPGMMTLYNSLGKMNTINSNGNSLPFKVSYSDSNHAVLYGSRSDGTLVHAGIKIPKMDGLVLTGDAQTTAHEFGHLMDFYNRTDIKKTEGWLSNNDTMRSIINNSPAFSKREMSEKMKALFGDADLSCVQLRKTEKLTHDAAMKALRDKYQDTLSNIYGNIGGYKQYRKEYKELTKAFDKAVDYESRNMMNGINNLEDVYDALSGGYFRDAGKVRYGHGHKYYSKVSHRIDEIWANYSALSVTRPDLVKLLAEDQPELVKALDEIKREMLGKVVK